jgi:hypothetical protein
MKGEREGDVRKDGGKGERIDAQKIARRYMRGERNFS